MFIRLIIMLTLLVLVGGRANAQLVQHVSVAQTGGTFSYTVFNDETSGSSNFISDFNIFIDAPVVITGVPDGWSYQTDGSSYVDWFNTDPALPYPHDIAPGASLGGFTLQSTTQDAAQAPYSVDSWDHSIDSSGPSGTGLILVPSGASPVPEASITISFGLLLGLGLGGVIAAKRKKAVA